MNKMTLGLYFTDLVKNQILLVVLGLPVYWLFMYLIKIGGEAFYILILVFTISVLVVYKYLQTNFIAPWFNKFEELPDVIPGLPDLKSKIYKMAKEKNFPLTHIYKVDASKRTGHSNAAVIGFGKN